MKGHGIENLRITLRPCVVDRDTFEAPFLAVAHEIAIVAIHQERVLRSGTRALPRHEMLSHDICISRGRVAADFDLEIADSVTGVERAEKRKQRIHDGLAAGEFGEIESEPCPLA